MPYKYEDHLPLKKDFPIIFAVEASDNMQGERLNETLKNVYDDIFENLTLYEDTKPVMAIVRYSDTAEIITNGFEDPNNFTLKNITTGGASNIGSAIKIINDELLKHRLKELNYYTKTSCPYLPFIVFITSSPSTDNYKEILAEANNYFRNAIKIAITIGDKCNMAELCEITGTTETIIDEIHYSVLRQLIVPIEINVDPISDFDYEIEADKEKVKATAQSYSNKY